MMNVPKGIVVSISASGADRLAVIEVDAAAVCARCRAGRGCGALAFASRSQKRRVPVRISAGSDVAVGDSVGLSLAPRNVLTAAVLVYGWPLTGAALGALFAYASSYGDAAASACALAGLAAGLLLARRRIGKSRCTREFMPRIVS